MTKIYYDAKGFHDEPDFPQAHSIQEIDYWNNKTELSKRELEAIEDIASSLKSIASRLHCIEYFLQCWHKQCGRDQ